MPEPALYKKLYEILKWSSVAALAITLALVLHTSRPPSIPYDANAAASAEQKFDAAGRARAAGQSGQVQLDRSELNSYLAQNHRLEDQPTAVSSTPQAASMDNVPTVGSAVPPDDPASTFPGGDQVAQLRFRNGPLLLPLGREEPGSVGHVVPLRTLLRTGGPQDCRR